MLGVSGFTGAVLGTFVWVDFSKVFSFPVVGIFPKFLDSSCFRKSLFLF